MFIDIYVDIEMGRAAETMERAEWRWDTDWESEICANIADKKQTVLARPRTFKPFSFGKADHKVILFVRPFERVSHSGERDNQVCEDCVDVEMINYFYYLWAESACAQIRRVYCHCPECPAPAPLSCTFVFSTLVLYCPIFIISTSS